jgi:hypothetical protein|tara:strand:+ start:604 stop:945 length:342 start_codon:yes stop_codon:yes gene_type:complete
MARKSKKLRLKAFYNNKPKSKTEPQPLKVLENSIKIEESKANEVAEEKELVLPPKIERQSKLDLVVEEPKEAKKLVKEAKKTSTTKSNTKVTAKAKPKAKPKSKRKTKAPAKG